MNGCALNANVTFALFLNIVINKVSRFVLSTLFCGTVSPSRTVSQSVSEISHVLDHLTELVRCFVQVTQHDPAACRSSFFTLAENSVKVNLVQC